MDKRAFINQVSDLCEGKPVWVVLGDDRPRPGQLQVWVTYNVINVILDSGIAIRGIPSERISLYIHGAATGRDLLTVGIDLDERGEDHDVGGYVHSSGAAGND